VHHAQGNYQQALADYDHSIDQQPNAPYVYRARAAAKKELGDEEGANQDHRQADRLQYGR
jgi:Flp pilus assembly protein TadD